MRKNPRLLLIAALAAIALAACGDGLNDFASPSPEHTPNPFGLGSEVVANGDHPVAMTFAPDGRIFFAEKFTGVIRVIDADGDLQQAPFADLDVAEWLGLDWGVTGMALDPDFSTSPYLYVFYTQPVNRDKDQPIAKPVLVRIRADGDTAGDHETLIDDFPGTRLDHQGFRANGGIRFGPDGYLYISMGDYDYGQDDGPDGAPPASDLGSPLGKVLRVTTDGSAAPGNPFADDATADARVFAYGFARPSEIAFQPGTTKLVSSDATDSCEELNVISAGGNYGWPHVGEFPFKDCNFGGQVKALYLLARPDTEPGQFQSYVGVTGLAFLTGDKYPVLGNGLLVCEKETKHLRRLVVSPDAAFVTGDDIAISQCDGSVAVGPDGTVYFSNATEIRRLVQGDVPASATATGNASPTP